MKELTHTDKEFICDINAPCFLALAPNEMEMIRTCKTQVQFRKGDNLTKQGTFASYIMFVAKGLAIQYIEGDNNKSYNLRIIQPGEFVGLSSVFSQNTFHYSSVAISDCHVLLVEKSAINQIIGQNGIFGHGLISRYTQQSISLFDTLKSVLYKQMMGRMAESLLYINSLKEKYPEIFTLLSRKHIADFAGITTESAVKILKSLENEKVINLNGKDVEFLNIPYLNELSIKG